MATKKTMAVTVISVEKAIDTLFLFDGERTVMDVKTIAGTLGNPLHTTYRLANPLHNRDVLAIEERRGLCRLNPRLRRLRAAIDDSADITRLTLERARALKPLMRETAAAIRAAVSGRTA